MLGVSPTEFWKMKPRWFWYLMETSRPVEKTKQGLTKEERRQMLRWIDIENGGDSRN